METKGLMFNADMICSVFFVCLMSLFFVHIKVALLEVFSSSCTWRFTAFYLDTFCGFCNETDQLVKVT